MEFKKPENFIDLNKLKDYECLRYANTECQFKKVLEEVEEVRQALTIQNGHMQLNDKNRDDVISETLDVITASVNLLYTLKITKEDFDKHIEKLERYKETKYKK